MKKAVLLLLFQIITGYTLRAQQVNKITLSQLEKRVSNPDTVYVVNFWATWCGPCVTELPNFEKLQTTYKDQPLKVLLVSMDFESKYKAVSSFAKSHKLQSEVFLVSRKTDRELIDAIDKSWNGDLPGTLIINTKKGLRQFYKKEFSYNELDQLYQTHKN
jgi:thiol-disulfide isomerase/thioredoxin